MGGWLWSGVGLGYAVRLSCPVVLGVCPSGCLSALSCHPWVPWSGCLSLWVSVSPVPLSLGVCPSCPSLPWRPHVCLSPCPLSPLPTASHSSPCSLCLPRLRGPLPRPPLTPHVFPPPGVEVPQSLGRFHQVLPAHEAPVFPGGAPAAPPTVGRHLRQVPRTARAPPQPRPGPHTPPGDTPTPGWWGRIQHPPVCTGVGVGGLV